MGTEEMRKCSQMIKKRRIKAETRRGYIQLFMRIVILLLIGWLLMTQVFLITQASDNDMFPAVKDGDLLIGFRLQGSYMQDDVVVYRVNDENHVGRIIAREGDVVTLDDTGTLLVNGTVQGGEIVFSTYAKEGIEYPYRVPDDCVFILGDYRTQAEDSRDFGSISLSNVKAKVITILRRREL